MAGGRTRRQMGYPVHRKPHRPKQITLHRLVWHHAVIVFSRAEVATGTHPSHFGKGEFGAHLECTS